MQVTMVGTSALMLAMETRNVTLAKATPHDGLAPRRYVSVAITDSVRGMPELILYT